MTAASPCAPEGCLQPEPVEGSVESRPRIEYLDSLRGLAAAYVVLGHATIGVNLSGAPACFGWLLPWLVQGRLGVAFFIVLSGYCLMMPVARRGDLRLSSSLRTYVGRRARRIYPPYLAAMVLSLGLLAALPTAIQARSFWLTTFQPAFGWNNLAAHLALVHNLNYAWLWKINAPFWSVATEWQIYFLFPLLLLPIARTLGIWTTVPIGLAIALLPVVLFRRFESAAPWFLALFAMGMCAANYSHAPGYVRGPHVGSRLGAATLTGFIGVVIGLFAAGSRGVTIGWKYECVVTVYGGAVAALLLSWLATSHAGQIARRTRDILHLKPLRAMGERSYSLYLTHAIAVPLVGIGLSYVSLPIALRLAIGLLLSMLASLALAWAFFVPFEQPFANHAAGRRRELARAQASVVATVSP